jgi:lysylphosphatidylglycerol synthetase-like protein (DUF2156 family)
MPERYYSRSSHFTLKAYVAAVITLVLGVLLSLKHQDWTWFSRSGSLIVIIGIILTSHQILEHMRNLDRNRRHDSKFNRDWAAGERQHYIHEDNEYVWTSEKYGLYMLVLGTFVWGFGDLIGRF